MRKALKGKSPNLDIERSYWNAGYETVAGLDEVGKGAWAVGSRDWDWIRKY